MGKTDKPFSSLLGERLTGQARLQPFRIAKNALEDLTLTWVDQLIENDLVNLGYGIGPVCMDAVKGG